MEAKKGKAEAPAKKTFLVLNSSVLDVLFLNQLWFYLLFSFYLVLVEENKNKDLVIIKNFNFFIIININ